MLVVGMILEHLLSPLQEKLLRFEARNLRQENARLKLSLDKARKKAEAWEEEKRQLVEDIVLPATKTIVNQYLKRRYYCSSCQKEIIPTHPDEIPGSHFGMTTLSLILVLKQKLHLPLSGIIFRLKNIWGLSLTPAGVQTQLVIAGKLFINPYQELLKQVRGSPVKHADETTWKVLGKLFWAWIIR